MIAYNDTNKSPMNTKANLFYLECGCLLVKKNITLNVIESKKANAMFGLITSSIA